MPAKQKKARRPKDAKVLTGLSSPKSPTSPPLKETYYEGYLEGYLKGFCKAERRRFPEETDEEFAELFVSMFQKISKESFRTVEENGLARLGRMLAETKASQKIGK